MNKVYVISLGCDKNRVDGEVMIGSLRYTGYSVINEPSQAQAIIVNTCGFISEAVQESIDIILELADHKTNGSCKALIVVGCMAARYKNEIATAIPEADEIIGVGEYENISALVKKYLPPLELGQNLLQEVVTPRPEGNVAGVSSVEWQGLGQSPIKEDSYLLRIYAREDDITPHIAYIKISEGCDNHCTYCTIPLIRGGYKSRPMENILVECEQLFNLGAKEFVLVAQDTALYGLDIYGRKVLPELITKIAEINKNLWIRLMYVYPEHITPELIKVMQLPQICKYIDMPIQHSETSVLARMGRKESREELLKLIHTLRNQISDITIRTTLMVGFPGETGSDFENMLEFVKEIKFDRLGAFPYSQEEGTPAATFLQQVDEDIKSDRLHEIMELQQKIHFQNQESKIGKTERVIIDSDIFSDLHKTSYIGRTQYDTYDVDTVVYIHAKTPLVVGQFYNVCITGIDQYDLIGEVLENEPS